MAKEQKYEMKPSNGKVLELQFEGRMTKQHLEFMEEAVKKYKIRKTTMNLDASIVIWYLNEESLQGLLADAEAAGPVVGRPVLWKGRKAGVSWRYAAEKNQ